MVGSGTGTATVTARACVLVSEFLSKLVPARFWSDTPSESGLDPLAEPVAVKLPVMSTRNVPCVPSGRYASSPKFGSGVGVRSTCACPKPLVPKMYSSIPDCDLIV